MKHRHYLYSSFVLAYSAAAAAAAATMDGESELTVPLIAATAPIAETVIPYSHAPFGGDADSGSNSSGSVSNSNSSVNNSNSTGSGNGSGRHFRSVTFADTFAHSAAAVVAAASSESSAADSLANPMIENAGLTRSIYKS